MTDAVDCWRALYDPFRRCGGFLGLFFTMIGWAIVGAIMVLTGIFLLVSFRNQPDRALMVVLAPVARAASAPTVTVVLPP